MIKDKTIFEFNLFAQLSEKNCTKFGLKKMKDGWKDKLFEIVSLILIEVVKFIWNDLNESLLKNFTSTEKEFIKIVGENLEENVLIFVENVLSTHKIDSPIALNTLKLLVLLDFRDWQIGNASLVEKIIDVLENIKEIHKDDSQLTSLTYRCLASFQYLSQSKERIESLVLRDAKTYLTKTLQGFMKKSKKILTG